MPEPRLTTPPRSKGSPVVVILVFALLALIAGGLTYYLYPRPVPPPPEPRTTQITPAPKRVELLVDAPPPVPAEPDASTAADTGPADADVDGATTAKRTTGGKRTHYGEGKIDPRRLSAFIRSKQGQVQRCYERRLKMNNMLQGVLVPEIRIHPSGSVMNVSFAQDTLNDQNVRECVARVIKSWQFPPPDGGAVTISNPFRFTPRVD